MGCSPKTGLHDAVFSLHTILTAAHCVTVFDESQSTLFVYVPGVLRVQSSVDGTELDPDLAVWTSSASDARRRHRHQSLADFNLFKAGFLSNDPLADLDGSGTVHLADFAISKAGFQAGYE